MNTKNPAMMNQGLSDAARRVFGIASSASPATTAPIPSICPIPDAARVACATPRDRENPLRISRPASRGYAGIQLMTASATFSHTVDRIKWPGVTIGNAAIVTCDVAPSISAVTSAAKARFDRGPATVRAHCVEPSVACSAISGLEYEKRPPMGSSRMLRTVRP